MGVKEQLTVMLNAMHNRRYDRHVVAIACDDDRTILGIRTPFNSHYIQELKSNVPSSEREWDPDVKIWFVNPTYYNIIMELCMKYFRRDLIRNSNTTGLELLNPTYKAKPKLKSDITIQAIKALNIEMDEFDYEEIVYVLVTAWRNKQITDSYAMELLDKLYS
jgi:hypothetical protein